MILRTLSLSFSFYLVLFFAGCGGGVSVDNGTATPTAGGGSTGSGTGGTGGGTGGGSSSVSSVTLNLLVADGEISAANVSLASIKRGKISADFVTNDAGKASLSMPEEILTTMDADDLVYIFSESTSSSRVKLANGSRQNLVSGQVRFRSVLGRVDALRLKASQNKSLNTFQELNQASTVSHFSNASTVLWENQLGRTTSFSPSVPLNVTAAELRKMRDELDRINEAIADNTTVVARKFKLIATATKSIVERGVVTILSGSSFSSASQADSILLELSANTSKEIAPAFQNIYNEVSAEVSQDLTSSTFKTSLGDTVANAVVAIPASTALNTVKSSPVTATLSALDLNVNTPVRFPVQTYLMPEPKLSGQALNAAQNYIPAQGRYVLPNP